MKNRILLSSIFFVALYSALILNLYKVQITKSDDYIAKSQAQNRFSLIDPIRGIINFTDKNNNLVRAAINKEFLVVYAVPKEVGDVGETVSTLVNILGVDEAKTKTALSNKNSLYASIAKKITDEEGLALREANLKGVYVESQRFRFYPLQDLAAHVLGFVAPNADSPMLSGRYGVEAFFDKELSGTKGSVDGDKVVEAVSGKSLTLTIDPEIEARTEEILNSLVTNFKAVGGSIIVGEPKTGKILALTNSPTFEPNSYSDYNLKAFFNPAVQGIYEPGSVFKVVTMAAGLNSHKLTPDTTYVDKGYVKVSGYTIKNWDGKANGKLTMTQVIEGSVNTGAVYAGQLIGKNLFYEYLLNFGFDDKTGVALPGEVSGNIKKLKNNSTDVDFATATFGQGVAVTPIELFTAISTIANGGVMMKPLINADDRPEVVRRVISAEAAKQTIDMMVSAVKEAKVAQMSNYYVAGKTGTAQVPGCGGYCKNEYIHTYVGFVPAYDPRFIVLIKLDKPNATLAGATVVPAFRELTEYLINYLNIPPDYINN